jgi:putative ABC transport system permease protein
VNRLAADALFDGKNPIGASVMVGDQGYTVVGVADLTAVESSGLTSSTVIVPVTAALSASYLINVYAQEFHTPDAVRVSSDAQLLLTVHAIHQTFTKLLVAMAAMALLLGGIGIMNVMLVSVRERTREIGVRMALGASREDILLQFLLEAMVLSLGGGLAGIVAGLAVIHLVPAVLHIPALYSVDATVGAFVFSMGAGLIFGIYPALRASGLEPIEALRYDV